MRNAMDAADERIDVREVTGPHRDLVARIAPAVCQIMHCPEPGVTHAIGTGALIRTPRGIAILTAGHVVAIGTTGRLRARFNYERTSPGGASAPSVDWDLAIAEHWVDGLDYGLAVACDHYGHPPPQNVFAPLTLGSSGALLPGETVLCLHHPNGEPKQCSAGTFIAFADSQLRYRLFTGAQSSGAPVLNLRGEVVAVHRAELSVADAGAKIGTAIDAIRKTSPGLGR
jgi:V8-like Glu-specific endopeptidase